MAECRICGALSVPDRDTGYDADETCGSGTCRAALEDEAASAASERDGFETDRERAVYGDDEVAEGGIRECLKR